MQLQADMSLPAKHFGLHSEGSAAADSFVLINLAFLFFVLGIGFVCAWLLWRRQTRPQPHVRLMMELAEEQSEPPKPASGKVVNQGSDSANDWEKDPEWWKGEEKDDAA
jgi:hypothetical protein